MAPGRVEKKLVQPGTRVTAETILMELSNPDVEIQLLQAQRQLTDAEAQLVALKISLETQRLTQAGVVAQTRSQYNEASRQAGAAKELKPPKYKVDPFWPKPLPEWAIGIGARPPSRAWPTRSTARTRSRPTRG